MNIKKFHQKNENFDKLYNQVYKENFKELSNSLKPLKYKIIFIIFLFIIFHCFMGEINLPLIILSLLTIIAFTVLIYNKNTKKYKHLYKIKVLHQFIQLYNKNLNYEPEKTFSRKNYDKAEFEKYDNYTSKDLISGDLDDYHIQMAQICTEKICITSKGTLQYIPIFSGFFTLSTFKNNFNETIKIRNDKGKLLNAFHKKNKIEMDSVEFEKYFDVISTNKIQTLQVLTPDVMNMLINFEQKYNMKIELTIKKQEIFIRFHSKTFFKPPIFSVINYKTLLRDYNLINFTLDLSRALIKSTAETKI